MATSDSRFVRFLKEYLLITVAVEIMVVGIYFFKFPNHFAFGGISGLASVISGMTGMVASTFTNIANYSQFPVCS